MFLDVTKLVPCKVDRFGLGLISWPLPLVFCYWLGLVVFKP